MSYAVQDDLVERFGEAELIQLTDRDNGATIDAAIVTRAIADAEADIDSFLASRYTVPLTPVPDVINRVCCDIARYYLHEDRVTDQVAQRYKDCVAILKAIAQGVAALSLGPAGEAPPPATSGIIVETPAQVFSQDSLRDYSDYA